MHFGTFRVRLPVALVALVVSAGCLSPVLMTSSSTPLAGRDYKEVGATTGESCMDSILGIPLSTDASLRTALARARAGVEADALIDVVVDRRTLFTLFYNRSCTVVHATGIRFTGAASPYLEPGPAVPQVPGAPAALSRPQEEASAEQPPAAGEAAAPAGEQKAEPGDKDGKAGEEKEKKTKKTRKTRKELKAEKAKKAREAREARRLARKEAAEKKKAAAEARRKAAEERKKQEEERKKQEEEKRKQEELARKRAEESKPVPDQYRIFCKYETGDPVRVETKTDVIDATFVKCVHFGVRVRRPQEGEGVIPFEQIWTVSKKAPPAPKQPAPATGREPASPRQPAAPRTPASPGR